SSSLTELEKKRLYYRVAVCHFRIGDYRECLSVLRDNLYDKKGFLKLYLDQVRIMGLCLLQTADYPEAARHFLEIISEDGSDYFHEALVNLSVIKSVSPDVDCGGKSAEALLERVISDHEHGKSVDPEVLAAAYYFIGARLCL